MSNPSPEDGGDRESEGVGGGGQWGGQDLPHSTAQVLIPVYWTLNTLDSWLDLEELKHCHEESVPS